MTIYILMCLLLSFTIELAVSTPPPRERDQVLCITPTLNEELQFIRQISSQYKTILWHPSSLSDIRNNSEIHLYVNASYAEELKMRLNSAHTTYRVMIEDVQQLIEKQKGINQPLTPRGFSSYYEQYHSLDEIYFWMSQMVRNYPSFIQQILIGPSSEKRLIYVLKIFKGTSPPKGAVWIDCGIHAREWVSPAFCLWFVQHLIGTQDKVIADIVNTLEIYVLPVWNVDGYEYTWTTDRFWRKNRSRNKGSECFGTDLNRNWDVNWCGKGASKDPCSQIFCGEYPESEPEVKAVATFFRQRLNHIKSYISVHSYSQMLLFPYSYTTSNSRDHAELHHVAQKAVNVLKSVHHTSYTYGTSAQTIYLSTGCSDDWAYDMGIKYSFTFELRDRGRYGFLLPMHLIKPTCEETTAAIIEMLYHIVKTV
ncbi:carboxypeptidase B2 [Callorhinchus milii]|uniref:Carboxypeptidase B2 (plasma) n=1 Tax=Callorhinchus milii TaxID=7868 RepID=A0A4W3IHJ4_CALMI|nr:carboxypeptidase B2 [Callorhinchus milii]|eukprot:gi/632949068/ref/XP_007889943.1/ PREDICTED: carboxypeptidase B2 [Callorhinchus milii]